MGATNCRFEFLLAKKEGTLWIKESIKVAKVWSQELRQFEEGIADFLAEFKDTPRWPSVLCMGVAGPQEPEGFVKMTQVYHWDLISVDSIKKNIGIPVIKILNDFEAIGYAVSKID